MKYVVWYKDPHTGRKSYTAHGSGMKYGVFDKRYAHRYPTRKAAKADVPVYDGSADIEKRTGVEWVLR